MQHPPRRRVSPLAFCAALALAAGCGDDDGVQGSGGGGGEGSTAVSSAVGPGAQVSSSSTGGGDGTFGAATAPDRTSIVAPYDGTAWPPVDAAAYTIESDRGPLAITGVVVDTTARTLTLSTEPQRLGLTYRVSVAAPGDVFDGAELDVVAADTAEFYATEFVNFSDYVVKARRVAVGERAVLYVEEGLTALDADFTRTTFDDLVLPTEQEVFRDPPDRDGNGRIVLLGLDGRDWYGGYYTPVNTLTDQEAQEQWGGHSNEMEIIYFNVAYMGGFDIGGVVPHELLHLLYAEEHDPFGNWNWHNEGLAECAVNAVWGENERSSSFYVDDPQGDLRAGKSLVRWEYSNYSQYAQSYVFLSYVAGQLGGVDGYSDLFHTDGDPAAIDALFRRRLDRGFAEVHLDALTAAWVQADEGRYGFNGMLELNGRPQAAPTDELALIPYAAGFFEADDPSLIPLGAGEDVVHVGVDQEGQVDLSAPFAAEGGVVIALNARQATTSAEPQSSGVLSEPGPRRSRPRSLQRDPAWLHPPPLPGRHPAMRAFRDATRAAR